MYIIILLIKNQLQCSSHTRKILKMKCLSFVQRNFEVMISKKKKKKNLRNRGDRLDNQILIFNSYLEVIG